MKPLLILFLLCVLPNAFAMIKDVTGTIISNGDVDILRGYMFDPEDAPAGDGQSYISYQGEIRRENKTLTASVEIIIFSTSCNYVGILDKGEAKYCCTPDLLSRDQCMDQHVGDVIFSKDKECVFWHKFEFQGNNVKVNIKKNVTSTDLYFLLISACDSKLSNIQLHGKIEWMNPYGYLPGEVYMHLPVSGVFAICHAAVLIAFGVLCIKYRKILLSIQFGILAVLVYCLIETCSWYFYRKGLNSTGLYSIPALCFVVFLANIKKTALRVLILLVCMGLGTVKWTLGNTRMKISYLAALYLFFSFFLQIVKELEALERRKIEEWIIFGAVVPAAALDTGFYYWIILSLIRTSQQLLLRKQVLKLQMFKYFFIVIAAASILALAVILYQGYLRWNASKMAWQHVWILDTFWEVLFFYILVSVAFLWRPRHNNARYGYAEFFTEEGDDDNNEIAMETISISNLKKRDKKEEYKSETRKKEAPVERDGFQETLLSLELPAEDNDEIDLETEQKKMD